MDGAASVFATNSNRDNEGRRFDWSNTHVNGLQYRPGGETFQRRRDRFREEYRRSKNFSSFAEGETRLPPKFIFAVLIFIATAAISHFMRDHIRLYVQLASDEVFRAGPVVQRQLNSAYAYLQASTSSWATSNNTEDFVVGSSDSTFSDRQLGAAHLRPVSLNETEKSMNSQPGPVPVRPSNSEPPIPLRDFALNTEYITGLTSHSFSNLGIRQRIGLQIFSFIAGFEVGRGLGQSPAMAVVDGGNDEQSCWIFPGSSGYLGIHLKERISVTKFTVDHLPRDLLSEFAILQAPRKIILWGRVDGPDNLSKERLYRRQIADGRPVASLYYESRFLQRSPRGELFIPLATFEYKLAGESQSSIQTKEVPQALQSLQMDFQVVVFEILSNWGARSTSLYRVRVHGNPLKAVALHAVST